MNQAETGVKAANATVSETDNLALLYEGVLTGASRVKFGKQPIKDVLVFRERIKSALQSVDRRAARYGYNAQESTDFARFAAVAFLDEAVLTTGDAGSTQWGQRSLQEELFFTSQAGEEFFERLEQLERRKDSKELADLLEVYLLCLQLGFQGRFATQPTGELRLLSRRILERIRHIRGRGRKFSPEGYLPEEELPSVRSDLWLYRLGWVALGVGVLAVSSFLLAWLFLGWNVESVLGSIG